ncbi:MAG: undecaprenyl/decaprenyl-phosphate alpha-N-acetylglucosaminyl 1-phosphate transferase [Gemmatimonadota bacterium]|nr:undecaprenyl/decaprenyl-phosphate alpha-N-acetylglucosaminyl 1-phosphate transferase [Gemmatimonadota bacterium]
MLPTSLMLLIWLSAAFALAVAASLIITPLVIRSAAKLSLFDAPDGARRLHALPVPRLGGVAVYLAFALASTAVFVATGRVFFGVDGTVSPDGGFLLGALLGSALLFIVGLIDDVRGLKPTAKFLSQILAALVAYYFGAELNSITLGYGVGVNIGLLGLPLLLLWIVGVTNAFNFIDGLNGLAAGIAIVACAATMIAALVLGNGIVLVPIVALGGALFGFLRYNFPRARVFLGDAGSLSVGFLLAVLSVRGAQSPGGSILLVVPLLALFVPILDTSLAVLRRWLRDVPLSGADARHIHHRLLALGLSQSRTAVVLWFLAGAMATFGLVLGLTAPFVAASIAIFGLVGFSVLVIYGTNLLSYHEFLVAGEVLLSAPSRARRIISDQILTLDVMDRIRNAKGFDETASILAATAPRLGFLRIELIGEGAPEPAERDAALHEWAWKLEYPLRAGLSSSTEPPYTLAIWCSADHDVRPYGAERAANLLAPALEQWLVSRSAETEHPSSVKREGTSRRSRSAIGSQAPWRIR